MRKKYLLTITFLIILYSCISKDTNVNNPEESNYYNYNLEIGILENSDNNYLEKNEVDIEPVIPKDVLFKHLEYPLEANKKKIEGIVYLELYINNNGEIKKIRILKSPDILLTNATINAFKYIICEPAIKNNNPVASIYRYPVRFKINY